MHCDQTVVENAPYPEDGTKRRILWGTAMVIAKKKM